MSALQPVSGESVQAGHACASDVEQPSAIFKHTWISADRVLCLTGSADAPHTLCIPAANRHGRPNKPAPAMCGITAGDACLLQVCAARQCQPHLSALVPSPASRCPQLGRQEILQVRPLGMHLCVLFFSLKQACLFGRPPSMPRCVSRCIVEPSSPTASHSWQIW